MKEDISDAILFLQNYYWYILFLYNNKLNNINNKKSHP